MNSDIEAAEYVDGEGRSVVTVDWRYADPRYPLYLTRTFLRSVPPSRHVSLAITKIEEAIMWLEYES